MAIASPNPSGRNRPTGAPKNAPSSSLFQKGFAALRNISAIQALVAISVIAAAGYGVKRHTDSASIEEWKAEKEQEKARAAILLYTPELYPTAESRVTYLRDKYGIDAAVLEGKILHDQNFVTKRTEVKECDCVTEHFTEYDLPRKVEAGDPKNFPAFLDAICRAVSKYPVSLFQEMNGLKIQMSGKIEIEGVSGGTIGGYADGPFQMIVAYHPDPEQNIETFDHEFLHNLDFKHNDLIGDDDQWILKSGSKADYIGYKLVLDDLPWTPPEGFARKYGKASVPEDQATIAENLFQPHYLKHMIRRALHGDKSLLMKLQLVTACIIDPLTEQFSRTMTLKEYQAYSGFDGYRYYHAWSPEMDHAYWNGLLSQVSTEEDARRGVARNMNDANADLISHITAEDDVRLGLHVDAGNLFYAAHESKLAKKEYLIAAAEAEKNDKLRFAADLYYNAGERAKAKILYEKSAQQNVAKHIWDGAAIDYARAGNAEKAHECALEFFKGIKAGDYGKPIKGVHSVPVSLAVPLMDVARECYDWKNLPDMALELLHAIAKEDGGINAIIIYEKLGEVKQRAASTHNEKDSEVAVNHWYLKMAKRLEAKGEGLDNVALLYEKGGSFKDAQRCLELYKTKNEGNLALLADAIRKLADLESRKK
ncbi:MAG: hypothetical protein NTX63_05550 [Candidatus Peregrinibacteria bacterium]|nr:hypothetical protein [Candidatus Peregrinibacteria bacterium]